MPFNKPIYTSSVPSVISGRNFSTTDQVSFITGAHRSSMTKEDEEVGKINISYMCQQMKNQEETRKKL